MIRLSCVYTVLFIALPFAHSAEESSFEESEEHSTEPPHPTKFSVGQKVCKPRFSEISTLYLGINAQDNRNEFDEFLELDFPPRECQNVPKLIISSYTIIVLDTRPIYDVVPGRLLYCSLHQRSMRSGSRHFVMGNRSDASRATRPFDVSFTHSTSNAMINSISHTAFTTPSVFVGVRPAEERDRSRLYAEVSDYPVVFFLIEKPSFAGDKVRMKKLLAEASYAKGGGGRRVHIDAEEAGTLADRDLWNLMFDYAVDVVVVNRNTHSTKRTSFIERMFSSFGRHHIRPSMVSVEMDPNTRDLPRGRSISLCVPEAEVLSYTREHTSTYWKFSRHTPGQDNDCTAANYLRVFDENSGYVSAEVEEYRYPDRAVEPEEVARPEERRPEEQGEMELGELGGDVEEVPERERVEARQIVGARRRLGGQRESSEEPEGQRIVPGAEEAESMEVEGRQEGVEVVSFQMPQFSSFSYEEKSEMMRKLDYLFQQAKSLERLQLHDARENARAAMLDYESQRRCNFMKHDMDLILNSGNFPNPRQQSTATLLQRLTEEKFKYFKPLFPNQWQQGRRVLKLRCEPCYEYYKSIGVRSRYAISTEEGDSFTSNVLMKMKNHMRIQNTIHLQAVERYVSKTSEIVSNYLDTVDRAPTDPAASGSRLFMLAYTAAKMYLPPYQFPTLCAAMSGMGVDIGEKQHTRDGFVKMTDFISKSMRAKLIEYIKKNQSPFSLLVDTSTDPGSRQVLLLFIRFPDRFSLHPTTHFMEALEMTEAETGQYIFDRIYEYFATADLLNEFTWNLVAVATDGAYNMNGPVRGLRGILNRNVSETRKNDLRIRGDTEDSIDAVPSTPVLWIHCMAHKIELALADALSGKAAASEGGGEAEAEAEAEVEAEGEAEGEAEAGAEVGAEAEAGRRRRRRARQFIVWRKFATTYLNKLRVFFSAPSRLRVLRNVHNIVENEDFVKLKGIIAIRWTSSEENAIHSFMRMYKHVWIALQQISLSERIDTKERMKAASFLRVMKSLKFYRYMVFQLQILGGIGELSRQAQKEASLLWKAERDLDQLLAQLNEMAENPNHYEKTKPFLQDVLCKPATERGHFRQNALDSRDCERWFWKGWQYEGFAAPEIKYKLKHDTVDLFFNRESERAEEDEEQSILNQIANQLDDERRDLIHWLRHPADAPNFDEENSRKTISELRISEEFRLASFTNMDYTKRNLLVSRVGDALRNRLEYEHDSVLYAISGFSPSSIRNYNSEHKDTRDKVSSFFGYPSLEEDVQELSRQIRQVPVEQKQELNLAESKMQYFLPVLRKYIRSGPTRITYRRTLMNLLAKIVAIPISTAEVERGFSIYSVIREPRRSRTTTAHISNYLRIAISGPEKLSPYEFLQYPTRWFEEARHQPPAYPGATRGPGKKSQERLEEERKFLSIFDPNRFYTQFYFSLSDVVESPVRVLENQDISILDIEEF